MHRIDQCRYCGVDMELHDGPGRPRLYCRDAHRVAHAKQRKAEAEAQRIREAADVITALAARR